MDSFLIDCFVFNFDLMMTLFSYNTPTDEWVARNKYNLLQNIKCKTYFFFHNLLEVYFQDRDFGKYSLHESKKLLKLTPSSETIKLITIIFLSSTKNWCLAANNILISKRFERLPNGFSFLLESKNKQRMKKKIILCVCLFLSG